MNLDITRAHDSNEWNVTLNGAYIIGFAGPDAHGRARRHCAQLHELLARHDTSERFGASLPDRSENASEPGKQRR